ncbi:PIN domain-containing protein [Gemmata sp.]|uniref:PIN domain-containing protein n=1 Tax=Gemmata sp. TaxID=1914242 RepID=UPI003F704DB0
MPAFTALFDANVLYPAPLRDCVMRLALTGLFRARWSNDIHEEWIRNVLANRSDLTRERLERTRDLMNAHAGDCLVTGYEALVPSLALPDEGDRHVLAAAIAGRADVIVTFNLKDFPDDALRPFGVSVQHPDEFVCDLIDLDSGAVAAAVRAQRASLKNPPRSAADLLQTLRDNGLVRTVDRLTRHLDEL